MRILVFLFVALGLLTANAQENPSAQTVKVIKSRGAMQCEPDTGTPPEVMRKELEQAGIAVESVACGTDGKIRAAMCGTPEGVLNIFEIPAAKLAHAARLKFEKLGTLPDAREVPCP